MEPDIPPLFVYIGAAVATRRKKLGWSLQYLGRRSGIYPEKLACIERGTNFPMCIIPALNRVKEFKTYVQYRNAERLHAHDARCATKMRRRKILSHTSAVCTDKCDACPWFIVK